MLLSSNSECILDGEECGKMYGPAGRREDRKVMCHDDLIVIVFPE